MNDIRRHWFEILNTENIPINAKIKTLTATAIIVAIIFPTEYSNVPSIHDGQSIATKSCIESVEPIKPDNHHSIGPSKPAMENNIADI